MRSLSVYSILSPVILSYLVVPTNSHVATSLQVPSPSAVVYDYVVLLELNIDEDRHHDEVIDNSELEFV